MNKRGSGIFLHITSLPSPLGIGDLGPSAYRFVDFLWASGQSYWQVLPLNPTTIRGGNSPYSTPSAFAGNPLLISLDSLVTEGNLSRSDIKQPPSFPAEKVDYRRVIEYKKPLLRKAFENFKKSAKGNWAWAAFASENSAWLEDYSLFAALRPHFGGRDWSKWPRGARDRDAEKMAGLRKRLQTEVEWEQFLQFVFFRQWFSLKGYCRSKGIQVIGDAPFYVDHDSADVWANPEIFNLDGNKKPLAVAGIPPDYFSATGQLWGNPVYRWDELKKKNYSWWVSRVAHNFRIFDFVRLDHFKGFVEYWAVPAGERTAVKGRWVQGPGDDFFRTLLKSFPCLPFIAEDLGVITPEVQALRERFEFPGMRVLQFAFGNDPLADGYKPHSYGQNCVAYPGTHDNDTLIGWLYGAEEYSTRQPAEIRREREQAFRYLGVKRHKPDMVHWEFIRLLLRSAARLVIIPMQDLLGLGGEARMNRPATAAGNWEWRLSPGQITPGVKKTLREMTRIYGRE